MLHAAEHHEYRIIRVFKGTAYGHNPPAYAIPVSLKK